MLNCSHGGFDAFLAPTDELSSTLVLLVLSRSMASLLIVDDDDSRDAAEI
jgi:hypothetical protein